MVKSKLVVLLLLSVIFPATGNSLKIPGGKFSVNWQSDFDLQEREKIEAWLLHAANSASLINGQFPRQDTQIEIKRTTRGSQAVPWAHTVRGTTPEGVNFHVNPNLSLDSFTRDWTAVHEFSHLYLPYVGKSGTWISEGFASYYQNLLMARAGTLSELEMWQKLSDGFNRGKKDKNQNITLGELSPKMRQKRAFMRVYWSGALYFLEMDISLHQSGQSLDAVVTEFNHCCRAQHEHWNGSKLVEAFDKIAGISLFSKRHKAYESEKTFRDYARVISQLGLELNGKKVVFSTKPDLAELRHQIMAPDY